MIFCTHRNFFTRLLSFSSIQFFFSSVAVDVGFSQRCNPAIFFFFFHFLRKWIKIDNGCIALKRVQINNNNAIAIYSSSTAWIITRQQKSLTQCTGTCSLSLCIRAEQFACVTFFIFKCVCMFSVYECMRKHTHAHHKLFIERTNWKALDVQRELFSKSLWVNFTFYRCNTIKALNKQIECWKLAEWKKEKKKRRKQLRWEKVNLAMQFEKWCTLGRASVYISWYFLYIIYVKSRIQEGKTTNKLQYTTWMEIVYYD